MSTSGKLSNNCIIYVDRHFLSAGTKLNLNKMYVLKGLVSRIILILICMIVTVWLRTKVINANLVVKRLYEDLFSDYNRWVLPVANNRSKVTVVLGLKLGQILDLNLKQQVLSTNVWVEQTWFDNKLSWDPEKYAGIEMVHVPAEDLWIPDIVLFNNADGNYELNMLTKAKVFHNGMIEWKPPTMFKSTCEIDVEYFPFDVQSCLMRFGSWTYAGDEVEIRHKDNKTHVPIGIDLTEFYKNVEWDIIEVPAQYNEEFYDCCSEPYPDITFKIVIRRKILFYMVNLILPTAVMASMTVFVFYLPSKSDEKVTLSISILISLIVFFLLMLEIIPASSLAVPLFGKYLLFTLVLVSLSTCVTVFVLNIHYRSPSVNTISPRSRKLLLETLPYYLGIKRPDAVERSSLIRFRSNKARATLSNNHHNLNTTFARTPARVYPVGESLKNQSMTKSTDANYPDIDDDPNVENEGRYFRRHIDNYKRCKHATIKNKSPLSAQKDQAQNLVNCKIPNSLPVRFDGNSNLGKSEPNLDANAINNLADPIGQQFLQSNTLNIGTNRQCSLDVISRKQQSIYSRNLSQVRSTKLFEPSSSRALRAVDFFSDRSCHGVDGLEPQIEHIRMPNEDTLDTTFDYDDDVDDDLPSPPPPPQPLSQADPVDDLVDDDETINDESDTTNDHCLFTPLSTSGASRRNIMSGAQSLRNLCSKCYSESIGQRDMHSQDNNVYPTLNNLNIQPNRNFASCKENDRLLNNILNNKQRIFEMKGEDGELEFNVIDSLCQPYEKMPAHLRAAIRSILFIADTIKNEDVENNAIEDWNFMSMVIDRLFLWIFTTLCLCGSLMLLMFAPSLYDNRPSIDDLLRVDIPMTNCSRNVTSTI